MDLERIACAVISEKVADWMMTGGNRSCEMFLSLGEIYSDADEC